MRRSAIALALLLLPSCHPGPGTLRLESRSGRVVDVDEGRGLPASHVFQVYWGPGIVGEPRPVRALRWVRSNEAGAFRFDPAESDEGHGWLREVDPPEYGFFHPDFGLVRAGTPPAAGDIVLRGKRLDEAGLRASEQNLCGSRPADAVIAAAARIHCSRDR